MASTPAPRAMRIPPNRPPASLRQITALVSVPAHPSAVRAFTADEVRRGDAASYANETGGTVVALPTSSADLSK